MIKHNIVSRDEIKDSEERLVKKWIALPAELTKAEKYILKRLDYDIDISKDDEPLVVGGPCSVAVLDKESHLITTKALAKAFGKFMLNPAYANINFQHCLTPETLVNIGTSTEPTYKPISEIEKGDYVVSSERRRCQVEETLKHAYDTFINVLQLENGETIRITDGHKVLTRKGWREAEKLTASDVLLKINLRRKGHMRQYDYLGTWEERYGKDRADELKVLASERGKEEKRHLTFKKAGIEESKRRKGKTWLELYGEPKAQKHFLAQSKSMSGKNNPMFIDGRSQIRRGFDMSFDQRDRVRRRDEYKCQVCGRSQTENQELWSRDLTDHHIDYDWRNNVDSNLITLCETCHGKTTPRTQRDFWQGFLTHLLLKQGKLSVINGTEITAVKREKYTGFVYNLHVEKDRTYCGKGIVYHNSDMQVAQALPFWVGKNGDIYKSGVVSNYLYLLSALRDDIEVAGRTAEEIREGNIKSYSIAGSVLDKELKSTAGKVFYQINGLELGEVSYCLPGEELVWTEEGCKPIKDIQVGEKVLTHKCQWKPVISTFKRQVNENLVKVITSSGSLIATREHPVRVLQHRGRNTGTRYEWIPIKKVQEGDFVAYFQKKEGHRKIERELESQEIVKQRIEEFVSNTWAKIVYVEEIPFSGLVFNLEVADDDSYCTKSMVVHNCANPVNQEAHFEILKDEEDKIELSSVLKQFTEPIRLTDYTVALVGGVIKKGESDNDIDLVIRADEDSFIGRAIRLRLSRDFPDIRKKLSFIYEQEGPHGSFIPLYHLQLVPNSQAPEVVKLGNEDNDTVGKRLGDPKTDIERLKTHFGNDWKNHDISELPERGGGLEKLDEYLGKQAQEIPESKVTEKGCTKKLLKQLMQRVSTPPRPGLIFDPMVHRWIKPSAISQVLRRPEKVKGKLDKLPDADVKNIVETLQGRMKTAYFTPEHRELLSDAMKILERRKGTTHKAIDFIKNLSSKT